MYVGQIAAPLPLHKWSQTNIRKGAPGIHPNYLNSQWTYLSNDVVKLVVMNRLVCVLDSCKD